MKKSAIFKSTIIVMIMTVISRFIGFARDIIIVNSFGTTGVTDAYWAASTIPETIFMIVGLAISTSFLPMLSKVRSEKGTKEMHSFANNVITILFIISIAIFLVASFIPGTIVEIIAGGLEASTKAIAIDLTRIVLINLVFLSINACFTALLQVHEDFVIPSILGLFFNLPIIVYLLIFKDVNIYGLTVANVIGNFLRVAVQVPSLRKHGYQYRPFINLKDERIKTLIIIILPVLVGSSANSLNLVVDKRIASGFGEGAITTLNNAQLLVTVVNTVITTAITSVIYPVLANKRNEGNKKEFIDILSKTIIYLGILLIPITIGMLIYGKEILMISFNYSSEKAMNFALAALMGYSIGIFFTGVRDVLNSTLFSMGKTKITTKNGVIGVIINIILSILLSKYIGIGGITIASSIAMFFTSILLFRNIIKLEGALDIKSIIIKLGKIFIAALLMGIIVYFLNILVVTNIIILKMALGVVIGALVYFALIYIMKVKEVEEIVGYLLAKLKR